MGRAERLPTHPPVPAPMGRVFDVRRGLPAATMDGPGRDHAPLGAIAQLGERLDRTQEVGGSSPPSSISMFEVPYFDVTDPAFSHASPELMAARERSWYAHTNYG